LTLSPFKALRYGIHPTENQTMIAQAVRDLCEREVRPNVMEWDESQHFPKELFTKHFGPAGMLGVFVPEEYGGSGLGYNEYVETIVEVARICGSIGLSVAAHNSLCTGHINYFGNARAEEEVAHQIGHR
jgi:alkylation response protein AidB-like acyl-CoA dehydrogenase